MRCLILTSILILSVVPVVQAASRRPYNPYRRSRSYNVYVPPTSPSHPYWYYPFMQKYLHDQYGIGSTDWRRRDDSPGPIIYNPYVK